MKTKKAYYKVDLKNQIITIDDEVKPTPSDKSDVEMYLKAGYMIKHKSIKRANVAKERAKKNNITDAEIIEALKKDKDEKALNKYIEIKKGQGKGTGFFAAKSWYLKEYKKEKENNTEE